MSTKIQKNVTDINCIKNRRASNIRAKCHELILPPVIDP